MGDSPDSIGAPEITEVPEGISSTDEKPETGVETAEIEEFFESGRAEKLFADIDTAKEQSDGFIDLVKGRDYFEVDEEGERVVEELGLINQEMSQLGSEYGDEKQRILEGEEKVFTEGRIETQAQEEDTPAEELSKDTVAREVEHATNEIPLERSLVKTLQKAGYPVESGADLPKLPAKITAELDSYEDRSLILPEEKLVLVDQVNDQNKAELDRLVAMEYQIITMPLIKEDEKISRFIYLIKTLIEGERRYLMLVQPEYYNRTNEEGQPQVALAVQKASEQLDAQVQVIPNEESEAIEGNILQLGDGKTLLPEGQPRTQELLESGVGSENMLLTGPSEGFKLDSLAIPSISVKDKV